MGLETAQGTHEYIEKSLGANERIVALAHFHWWYTFKAWLALIFSSGASSASSFSSDDDPQADDGDRRHHAPFRRKDRAVHAHTNEIALHNIEGVRVEQRLWGRILGYGHLRIEGTGVDAVTIPDIADPIAFRAAIETAKSGEAAPDARAHALLL